MHIASGKGLKSLKAERQKNTTMKLSELKEQLFPNWNWTDKFLAECLEEFLVKVNSGKILPINKKF